MADETKEPAKMKDKKIEDKKIEKSEIKEEPKAEAKVEQKAEIKKEAKPKITKKEEVIAKGLSLHASLKQCMAISRFIKNKTIEQAIADLGEVIKLKRAIPFTGEIPHRKGMMSGRYPLNASKLIVTVLKGLKGNALANGFALENTKITFASANWASRPAKRGGARFKRVNILFKAKEVKQ